MSKKRASAAKRATRTERAGAAARERACRGARGAQPLGQQCWATFDCYGTLIDWNGGIGAVLARVFGTAAAAGQLRRFHEIERRLEEDGRLTYREVLTAAMRELGAPPASMDALAASLPSWPPFPDVAPALRALRERGWRLAILSNTDRDYIDASMAAIAVPFDLSIVASEIHSYKPARLHWDTFVARTGADRTRHVHVAASLFHDIAPAAMLDLRVVWINRLGERSSLRRDAELPNLVRLPEVLDSLA